MGEFDWVVLISDWFSKGEDFYAKRIRFKGRVIYSHFINDYVYKQNGLVAHAFIFVSVFAVHLPVYIVAIIGVDRYVRIKHYASFKTIWTTKVAISLISISAILALFHAATTFIGLFLD